MVAGSPVSDSESAGFDDDAGQDDLGDFDAGSIFVTLSPRRTMGSLQPSCLNCVKVLFQICGKLKY